MGCRSEARRLGRTVAAILLIGAPWVGAGCHDESPAAAVAVSGDPDSAVDASMPGSGGGGEPVPNAPVGSQPSSGSPDVPAGIPTAACGSPTDAENCGFCGHDCTALPNVVPEAMGCSDGLCVYGEGACRPGFGHCSPGAEGCQDSLGQTAHCGSCDTTCTAPARFCASPPGEPARCVDTCAEGS